MNHNCRGRFLCSLKSLGRRQCRTSISTNVGFGPDNGVEWQQWPGVDAQGTMLAVPSRLDRGTGCQESLD